MGQADFEQHLNEAPQAVLVRCGRATFRSWRGRRSGNAADCRFAAGIVPSSSVRGCQQGITARISGIDPASAKCRIAAILKGSKMKVHLDSLRPTSSNCF